MLEREDATGRDQDEDLGVAGQALELGGDVEGKGGGGLLGVVEMAHLECDVVASRVGVAEGRLRVVIVVAVLPLYNSRRFGGNVEIGVLGRRRGRRRRGCLRHDGTTVSSPDWKLTTERASGHGKIK